MKIDSVLDGPGENVTVFVVRVPSILCCSGPEREAPDVVNNRVIFVSKLKNKIEATCGPTFAMSSDLVKAFADAGTDMPTSVGKSTLLHKQAASLEQIALKVHAVVLAAGDADISVDKLASYHNVVERAIQLDHMKTILNQAFQDSVSKFKKAFSLAEKVLPLYDDKMADLKASSA